MELRQLRYVIAVANHRHFTRAAAAERVAQSALSHQVRRLEAELGVDLFDRETRPVALTEAGEVLVVAARRALADLGAAEAHLAALKGLTVGRVAIGAMRSVGPVDLPALLAAFVARHPGIDVTLREDTTAALFKMVAADEVDLVVAAVDDAVPAGLAVRVLADEPLVCALSRSHRLAKRRWLGFDALAGERFVSFAPGTGLRAATERAAANAGVALRVQFETGDHDRLLELVSRGLAVAIVPASLIGQMRASLTGVPLDPPVERRIGLVWRAERHRSPAADAFLRLALDGS